MSNPNQRADEPLTPDDMMSMGQAQIPQATPFSPMEMASMGMAGGMMPGMMPSMMGMGMMGLPGTQALMNNPIAQQQIIQQQGMDMARTMQQSALMSGDIERHFKTILGDVEGLIRKAKTDASGIAHAARRGFQEGADQGMAGGTMAAPGTIREALQRGYLNERARTARAGGPPMGPGPARHAAPLPHPADDPTTAQEGPTGPGAVGPGARLPRAVANVPEGRAEFAGPRSYAEGREIGTSISKLRQLGAARLNQFLSERTPTAPYSQDADGTLRYGVGHPQEGQPVGPRMLPHAQSEMERFARSASRRGRIIGGINAIGGEEGLSGALGAFGRVAGPVGIAVGVGQFAVQQAEQQREANRYYQQISGGSNISGFGERAREALFGLQGIGTMGRGRAQELFRGVSELGLTEDNGQGDTRSRALDFARQQFMKTGMDIADSIGLVRTALQNGQTDFDALGKTLDNVSKSARQSGLNVAEAQKQFAATYQQVSQGVTNNASAPQIAGALSTAVSEQGRRLESVNYTGALNMQGMTMQATALGINPLQYRAQVGSGTAAGVRLLGQGLQSQIDQVRQTLITPQQQAQAQQMVQSGQLGNMPNGELTPQQADKIGRSLGINPEALIYSLQARGITGVTDANVYEYAGKMAVGGVNLARQFNREANRMQGGGLSAAQRTSIGGQDIARGGVLADEQDTRLRGALGYHTQTIASGPHGGFSTRTPGLGSEANKALSAYEDRVHSTGHRQGVIEDLLKRGAVSDDTKFLVNTRDGQRQVSLSEAVRDYSDQLRTGRVTILSGSKAGQTVGDVTGVTTSATAASETQKAKSGSKDVKAPSGSVRIEAGPMLMRMFKIQTTGGAYLDSAGTAGQSPAAFPGLNDLETANGYGG